MLPEWIGAVAALAILAGFSLIQFRHIALALATVLAPLPGYIAALFLGGVAPVLCYFAGLFAATVLASRVESHICEGHSSAVAVKEAAKELALILVWPLALIALAFAVPFVFAGASPIPVALSAMLSSASGAFVLMLAARFLPYSEDFIASANRLRESREHWLDRLTFVVQPRWGWSVSGIALIFATLGYFGASLLDMSGYTFPALCGVTVFVIYASTRNVRRSIAAAGTAGVLACMMFWVEAHLPSAEPAFPTIAMAFAPVLIMAAQSAAHARAGDNPAVASLRAFEQMAVPVIFFSIAAGLALLVLHQASAAILMPLGGIAALIVFPAMTTMIYDLFPPRVSLDAYRIR